MMTVRFTVEAAQDFNSLPGPMKGRVCVLVTRLANWPGVSGAKALRGDWTGYFRVRTGDWRAIFYIANVDQAVVIVRIAHRSTVYEE